MKFIIPIAFILMMSFAGCSQNRVQQNNSDYTTLSTSQQQMLSDGWYIPKTKPAGELSKEYGVENKYGQQDNYFDIVTGNGCDVALKIIDASTDKCIRFILVQENTAVNIQMIPQGKYYLKLAYGKDWMEYANSDGSITGKFTKNVSYDKSVDIFDFGKKNSSNIVSYVLHINVLNSQLQNNFGTTEISEDEFFQ